MPRAGWTALTITESARDKLRTGALAMSPRMGWRVSMPELAVAALAVAEQHPEEFEAALQAEHDGTDTQQITQEGA